MISYIYYLQVQLPKQQHEIAARLHMEHLAAEKQKLDSSSVFYAVSQRDPQNVYNMMLFNPIVKESFIKQYLNNKSEINSKIIMQHAKITNEFFEKIFIMSNFTIDDSDPKEAYKDMKALLNMFELAQYAGYQFTMTDIFSPQNKKIILQWKKSNDVSCSKVATDLILLSSTLLHLNQKL